MHAYYGRGLVRVSHRDWPMDITVVEINRLNTVLDTQAGLHEKRRAQQTPMHYVPEHPRPLVRGPYSAYFVFFLAAPVLIS